jgi:type IV pilus assembly protein PilP
MNVSRLMVCVLGTVTLLGCEDDVVNAASPDELAVIASANPPPAAAPGPGALAAGAALNAQAPKIDFSEEDFAETDRNRDPFRSFLDLFVEHTAVRQQAKRPVVLENFALDDLKLIGLITGIVPAKAMLTDPGGKGHVIQKNDLVGRAERVQAGASNTEYEINWRVDQIRESDVVFVREDPSNPDVPSATRVIALRTAEEEQELHSN